MSYIYPYSPGETTRKQFSGYNPYQEALWEAFCDAYFAWAYGYAQSRHPSPALVVDNSRYTNWKKRVIAMSKTEAARYKNLTSLEENDWPENLWMYLYEQMLAAASLKPNDYGDN